MSAETSEPLPSIRSQITLLVLACILPALVGLGLLVLHFYHLERSQVVGNAQRMARALAAAVDRDLQTGQSAARALASSPSLQNNDFTAFTSQAAHLLLPDFPGARILLSRADGRILADTGAPADAPELYANTNANRLHYLFAHGQPGLSNLAAARGQPPLFAIDVPVLRDGGTAFALSVVYRAERLKRLLEEQHLPDYVIVGLLDPKGIIMARNRDAERYVGQATSQELREKMLQTSEGQMQTYTLEGTPVYASFSRAQHSGWTVAVGVPEDYLMQDLMQFITFISAGVLVLLIAGFALAWGVGGSIGRSVRALSGPARAMAAGEAYQLPPLAFREADEVGGALRQMSEDILRYRQQMQTLVDERTAELQQSKALLENLYATAPVGLSFVDPSLRIVMINDYMAAVNGAPVPAHLGHQFDELIEDPSLRAAVGMAYRQVLDSGQPIPFAELSGVTPSAPQRISHYMAGYFPVFDAQQELVGITGVLLDITASKQTEAELQRQRQLFSSVVENIPAMIFVKRASDLRYEMLNREGERLLCRSRTAFLGKTDAEVFPPEQARAFNEADRKVLASGRMMDLPDEQVSAIGGEVRYVTTRKVALLDQQGEPTHLLGISLDITERKRADAALESTSLRLARSNAFIRTVTDNLPAMVAYWDAGLCCRFANRRFLETFRLTLDQCLGATMEQVLGPRLMELTREQVAAALQGVPQNFARELQRRNSPGQHVWINYLPDFDEEGVVRGFFVLASDVTELKQRELELQELNQQLMHERDRAQAGSRAKSEFLANMSHEIRTPMNAIIGLARLLEESPLERRERSYVGKIQLATQALLAVVNDVLDFSKIEAGQLKLERARFNLDHILGSTSVLACNAAWDKGVEAVFDVAPDVPMELVGDAMRLQQILLNLMSNAVKFTERGEIVLAVRKLSDDDSGITLEFQVRDTGIGIDPEHQLRMFEAFSQVDTSTSRKYGGTGLGLAICRRLADLMDGTIGVESVVGQGSTFHFIYPMQRAPDLPLHPPLPPALQGLHVLLVDDNAASRAALQRAGEAFGWTVWSTASGQAALAQLRKAAQAPRPLDLLLIDSAMPEMDGVTVLMLARAEEGLRLPKVVVMAPEHSSEELALLAEGLRLDAILSKPATPHRLQVAALAALSGAAAIAAPPPPQPLSGRLTGMRVLLVEDNEINQEMAQYILLHAGARVEIAANGKIAVELLQTGPARCDAVLMDLQMPVMNGYEATIAIRALGLVQLPIIAMTANTLEEDRSRALDAGMDAHVGKPIDVDELTATLTRLAPLSASRLGTAAAQPAAMAADIPARLPGIDLDAALKRLAGNYPAFVGLLKRFENSQGDAVTEVRALLARSERRAATQVLHRLRGVAANLGASDVARLASLAELMLAEERDAELNALLISLSEAIDTVTGAARTLPLPVQQDGEAHAMDADLPQALSELVSLLQNSNLKALSEFNALRPALERLGVDDLPAVANAIDTLDFALAERKLLEMLKRKENQ
ncbi:PAS domain-containing protein [Massilia sp. erpn]|uniref:PAS domain-containing protein n=1 Tax=Massilia sp. erpn TaxID=2738142 RepID=UPI002104FC28|nr:PAS domain-containing protein [Massilia sp. erpn]UTY59895.1 PAS domain-containing protein [Massilia sp. erpn]